MDGERFKSIEAARRLINSGELSEELAAEILPELDKTRDGKVREIIIRAIESKFNGYSAINGISKEEALYWVENHSPLKPIFRVGDVMRTLDEVRKGITDGMPVVIAIDKYYYHCNNELIAIFDQNNYEYPPINVQKSAKD